MTGFGLATRDAGNCKITVEIKSLNSKFLELSLKMPKAYSDKELLLRNECSKSIERGKAYVALTVENNQTDTKTAQIDQAKLAAYYTQLKAAAANLGDTSNNLFSLALHLPEVISYTDETGSDEEWALILATFEQASKAFQQFRADEGAVLKKDLELRIQSPSKRSLQPTPLPALPLLVQTCTFFVLR